MAVVFVFKNPDTLVEELRVAPNPGGVVRLASGELKLDTDVVAGDAVRVFPWLFRSVDEVVAV